MQPSVRIVVLQGEREMAAYNKTLGTFELVDIPPAPRGIPQIEVTFNIDANGIVNVSAKDLGTNKEQTMTITGQSSLSKDEIARMMKDAEAHAEEDKARREEAEVRNTGEQLVYQIEKLLKDSSDKLPEDEKTRLESALADTKAALAGSDTEAIKRATDNLASVSQAATQKMYEAASASASAGEAGGSGGSGGSSSGSGTGADADDEVIDAEIVDEK